MMCMRQGNPRRPGRPDRLRVLMLVDRLRRGGAERLLVGLAAHLPRERFEVAVCTTRAEHGRLLEDLQAADVEHIAIDRRYRFDLAGLRRLGALFRGRRFHVLHAHKFGSNVWGTLLGRLFRVPVVIAHEHTWSYEGKPLRRLLDGRLIGRFADVFVAVSKRDRDRMISLEGVPPQKVALMRNAYVPRAPRGKQRWRELLGIPVEAPVVATACALRPQKALEVLIEAFARLSSSFPAAHLLIAGEGPCREALERDADRHGVSDRTHFLGWLEDLPGFLSEVDVAAMSSDYEGTPLFALECMAGRVPLVSTEVGGIGDVLDAGRSVLLVPRRDSRALAGALESLIQDPELRAAVAAAAGERLRPFEIARVAGDFADLYERLYAGSGQGNGSG